MPRRYDPARAEIAAGVVADLPGIFRLTRNLRGVSLRTAAEQIGTSHNMLSRLETGHLPNGETIVRILEWIAEDRRREPLGRER